MCKVHHTLVFPFSISLSTAFHREAWFFCGLNTSGLPKLKYTIDFEWSYSYTLTRGSSPKCKETIWGSPNQLGTDRCLHSPRTLRKGLDQRCLRANSGLVTWDAPSRPCWNIWWNNSCVVRSKLNGVIEWCVWKALERQSLKLLDFYLFFICLTRQKLFTNFSITWQPHWSSQQDTTLQYFPGVSTLPCAFDE